MIAKIDRRPSPRAIIKISKNCILVEVYMGHLTHPQFDPIQGLVFDKVKGQLLCSITGSDLMKQENQ